MKKNRMLEKIKSKHTLLNIFNYISDKNIQYKLFFYCKLLQKKVNFELVNYQKKFFDKKKINLLNYTSGFNKDINILRNKLFNDLYTLRINRTSFENYIKQYFIKKLYINDSNIKKNINLDINSPIFDILLKIGNFPEIINIQIDTNLIEKNNLKNNYISTFEQLYQFNIQYFSLKFILNNDNDINFIKELKINYNNIKRLFIIQSNNSQIIYFDNFNLLNNFGNKLTELDIDINKKTINPDLIKKINDFKFLKKLKMVGFMFDNTFILKLSKLQKLYIASSKNILLNGDNYTDLKELYLNDCSIIKPQKLLQFPNLELCVLENKEQQIQYSSIFNFENLMKLKRLKAEIRDFLRLKYAKIENIELHSNFQIDIETEKIMLSKIFEIKSLKEIGFDIYKIDNDEISRIKGENISINKLKVNWKNKNSDCILFNLQKKLPNLTNIDIYYKIDKKDNIILEMKEYSECKIDKIKIYSEGNRNISFYCKPYENIKKLNIVINNKITNLNDFLFFKYKYKDTFKSLTSFIFKDNYYYSNINKSILKHIYKNISKLPNLKIFEFSCVSKNVGIEFYENFIYRILSLDLDYINLKINENSIDYDNLTDLYSSNELKRILNIKNEKINNYLIYKLKY